MAHQSRALYLGSPTALRVSTPNPRRLGAFLVTSLLLFMALIAGASSMPMVAHADGDSAEVLTKAADAYGVKAGKDKTIIDSLEEQYRAKGAGFLKDDQATFGVVIKRLLQTGYMNYTPDGVGADKGEVDWNCRTNHPQQGTPLYHNCDVPNMMTEFFQDVIQMVSPMGFSGATVGSAEVPWGFGLPSTIPGSGEVPLDPEDRALKYTALELFGYNMRYTVYKGEWDHIRTMDKARAMVNYGTFDQLRVGGSAVVNGVASGTRNAVSSAFENISQGDVIGVVTGPFKSFTEGAASASINTILDTSDMNIFLTGAWYRVDYGGTIYNGRELSTEEQQAIIIKNIENLLSGKSPQVSELPAEFVAIEKGPAAPKENISRCVFNGREYGQGSEAPGISQEDCKVAATQARATATWTEDGNGKGETLEAWYAAQKPTVTLGAKYNINCTIDVSSEADRADKLMQYYICWEDAYTKAVTAAAEKKATATKGFVKDLLGGVPWVRNALMKNAKSSFNDPRHRFVCTDANGKDLLHNGALVEMFTFAGKLSEGCHPARPPVQNGYFGNGYVTLDSRAYNPSVNYSDEFPQGGAATDTRYTLAKQHDPITSLLISADTAASWGNLGLNVASFITRPTVTMVDLSFQPLFDNLGLTDRLVILLEGLRDSVYLPLIVITILGSLLVIFFRTVRGMNFRKGFVDIAILLGVFIVGTMALYSPRALFTVVDKWPGYVESAIVDAIYTTGNSQDDALCSASQTPEETPGALASRGELAFSPRAASRTISCEIWRTFVFNPYIAGQWGTNYENLYAGGASVPVDRTLQNKNHFLVGNAGVPMGGGQTIYNWGLYQLSALSSGTATTSDPVKASGYVPRNLYRVVDAQAGPDPSLVDGRYLNTWAGNEPGTRLVAGTLAAPASVLGFLTLGFFALAKIQITFVSILMLLFLPFVLLMGVHPTFGRVKLKQYVGTILGLMAQRIVLVTFMAAMLRIIVSVGTSSSNYFMAGILTSLVCLAFFLKRVDLLNLARGTVERRFGGTVSHRVTNSATDTSWLRRLAPASARNVAGQTKATVQGTATGALGGFMAGGVSGVAHGATRGREQAQARAVRHQRRRGIGMAMGAYQGAQAGEQQAKRELRTSPHIKRVEQAFTKRRQDEFRATNPLAPEGAEAAVAKFHLNPNDQRDAQAMGELIRLNEKMQDVSAGIRKRSVTRSYSVDISPAQAAAEAKDNREANERDRERLEHLKRHHSEVAEELYRRHEDPNYVNPNPAEELKTQLSGLYSDIAENQKRREGKGSYMRHFAFEAEDFYRDQDPIGDEYGEDA